MRRPAVVEAVRCRWAAALAAASLSLAPSAQAQQPMDTVKVVAERISYISPSLRGFEERRLKGHGRFIGEKEMRANEQRGLADVLAKLPGIRVIANNHERYVMSSRTVGGVGRSTSGTNQGGRKRAAAQYRPPGCYVSLYVDGLPVYLGAPDDPPNVDEYKVTEF